MSNSKHNRRSMKTFVYALSTVLFLAATCHAGKTNDQIAKSDEGENRDGKVFSLFSIVTFKNAECTSSSGTTTTSGANRNGTCFTSTECSDKGGESSGNCAAGFGVCCLFVISTSGSTIDVNNSYIQNPSYPSVYGSTTALTYTVNKCSSDVCLIRIDFETFTILGPTVTLETDNGHGCQDSFVVTATTSGLSTPTICGVNAGQHIYLDLGMASSDTATIAFTFATTTSTTRTWEMKVSQIECDSISRPTDNGCLQYHTGIQGEFKTFNFGASSGSYQHLASQRYSICIRAEDNYCCIQYQKCTDSYSFSLGIAAANMADQDTNCTEDHVGISGVMGTCDSSTGNTLHSRLCGYVLSTGNNAANDLGAVCDCSLPFVVDIYTDATRDAVTPTAAAPARGLCFLYNQLPCSVS